MDVIEEKEKENPDLFNERKMAIIKKWESKPPFIIENNNNNNYNNNNDIIDKE
jgi:hypothetical protein